jgi:hypothetical protein
MDTRTAIHITDTQPTDIPEAFSSAEASARIITIIIGDERVGSERPAEQRGFRP